ncbi:MAG: hypothetical protein JWO09_2793 [Bacteroidetes bacterium]|nr:hypothetical protein [Bacteroidota bacterium]
MPIEIKELLIRAFVGNQGIDEDEVTDPSEIEAAKGAQTAQDSIAMFSNMLKQEKER